LLNVEDENPEASVPALAASAVARPRVMRIRQVLFGVFIFVYMLLPKTQQTRSSSERQSMINCAIFIYNTRNLGSVPANKMGYFFPVAV
jgi:hypothetical protein